MGNREKHRGKGRDGENYEWGVGEISGTFIEIEDDSHFCIFNKKLYILEKLNKEGKLKNGKEEARENGEGNGKGIEWGKEKEKKGGNFNGTDWELLESLKFLHLFKEIDIPTC